MLERGLLLRLRFELDLYVNLRPFAGDGLDFVVIRENTEGTYAGEGGFLRKGTPHEVATQGSVNTRMGVERCVRYAFELARSRARASTSRWCTRPTCSPSPATSGSAPSTRSPPSTPTSTTAYNHVDAACIYFVQDPGRYDVIVTDNLFGDILTDLGGAVAGGIGLASSANLNPARTGPSLFEPVHGSAPDIVGTGKANPIAAILSAAMMLDFLGEADAAARIRKACAGRRADRHRPPRSATAIAARRRLSHAHHADREDLDERRARRLGRRQDPRPHPHAPLRHRRVRGHPRLRDRRRARPCSASPTTSSGCSTRPRS